MVHDWPLPSHIREMLVEQRTRVTFIAARVGGIMKKQNLSMRNKPGFMLGERIE